MNAFDTFMAHGKVIADRFFHSFRSACATILLFCTCSFAAAATSELVERGKAEEQRSCIACHGTRITHSQRLSRGAWEKELDKMVRWGSVIKDREALLEYLATDFSDAKPVPRPPLSGDGSKSAK